MSIIHVNQIATKVKELFGNLIDTTDLNKTDTQYELKLLSRCLAAYAVFLHRRIFRNRSCKFSNRWS